MIYITAYKKEFKKALDFLHHLTFEKQQSWPRNLIALYCSLIEYSESLIFLAENNKRISIPIIFRSLLEAFVDFKNLAEDKTYGYHMEASYEKEWLKVIKEAKTKNNAFLALLSEHSMLKNEMLRHQAQLDDLEKKGYRPLSQFDKFERAGMLEEYRSIYNFVCSHSHNNIRSLISRFFEIDELAQNLNIAVFQEYKVGEYDHYLQSGTCFLRNGSHNIHAILETGYANRFAI